MARATGSINYLEHRTPLKDESGKYQIHPMFVKRDIVDREKMEKRLLEYKHIPSQTLPLGSAALLSLVTTPFSRTAITCLVVQLYTL